MLPFRPRSERLVLRICLPKRPSSLWGWFARSLEPLFDKCRGWLRPKLGRLGRSSAGVDQLRGGVERIGAGFSRRCGRVVGLEGLRAASQDIGRVRCNRDVALRHARVWRSLVLAGSAVKPIGGLQGGRHEQYASGSMWAEFGTIPTARLGRCRPHLRALSTCRSSPGEAGQLRAGCSREVRAAGRLRAPNREFTKVKQRRVYIPVLSRSAPPSPPGPHPQGRGVAEAARQRTVAREIDLHPGLVRDDLRERRAATAHGATDNHQRAKANANGRAAADDPHGTARGERCPERPRISLIEHRGRRQAEQACGCVSLWMSHAARRTFQDIVPTPLVARRNRPEFGRTGAQLVSRSRARFGRIWLNLVEVGPQMVEAKSSLVGIGLVLREFGLDLVENRAKLGRFGPRAWTIPT